MSSCSGTWSPYFKLDRYDEAAASFQRALAIRPTGAVYRNLGTLFFFQGRYRDAVSAFQKAVDLGANSYLSWGNLADAMRWTSGYQTKAPDAYRKAIALAKEATNKNPKDAELASTIATYLAKSGDCVAANTAAESRAHHRRLPRSYISSELSARFAGVVTRHSHTSRPPWRRDFRSLRSGTNPN